jgi:hypothetical protein
VNAVLSSAARRAASVLLVALAISTPAGASCCGDCNGDGGITVDEIVSGVNIALGLTAIGSCLAFDTNGDADVTVDEVLCAVANALDGCPTVSPTEAPEPTVTPTEAIPSPTAAAHTPTSTATAIPSATATATAAATPEIPTPEPVPTIGSALRPWLEAGNYLDWPVESARHPSAGPHFGAVRTFVNPTLYAALQAGSTAHPQGSALVKELYGSGETVRGWSVMVKVQADSDGGNGWYWFERFGTSGFANGLGEPGCTGCHSLGNDFVRTPFPLQ